MENKLIQAARALFDQNSVESLANQEHIPANQIEKGIDTAIPALLLSLQQKSAPEMQGLLDRIRANFTGNDFNEHIQSWKSNPESFSLGSSGTDLIGSIFSGNSSQLLDKIAGFIGLGGSNLLAIVKTAIPTVIAAITNNGSRWNAHAISQDLNENRAGFLSALPAGLASSLFGSTDSVIPEVQVHEPVIDPVENVVIKDPIIPHEEAKINPRPTTTNEYRPPVVEEEAKKSSGLWWILVPLLLLLLWFLFGKSCNRDEEVIAVDTTTTEITPVDTSIGTVPSTEVIRENIMVTLPNNETINAYKGGIEDQLVNFLNTDYTNMSEDDLKNKWFDFDNLNFETGTSNILPESQVQVDNLAAIFAAFPNLKVKIGGYTDKTGDETLNKKLSDERALAVKNALAAKNVGDRVEDTEGYGSEFAKFDATAPEADRVKDRRVSISVRK